MLSAPLAILSSPQLGHRTFEWWPAIRQVCPADWTPPYPMFSAHLVWLPPPPVPLPAYPRCCNRLHPHQSHTDHLGSKLIPLETLCFPSARRVPALYRV